MTRVVVPPPPRRMIVNPGDPYAAASDEVGRIGSDAARLLINAGRQDLAAKILRRAERLRAALYKAVTLVPKTESRQSPPANS